MYGYVAANFPGVFIEYLEYIGRKAMVWRYRNFARDIVDHYQFTRHVQAYWEPHLDLLRDYGCLVIARLNFIFSGLMYTYVGETYDGYAYG